jgi:hypothetical protein
VALSYAVPPPPPFSITGIATQGTTGVILTWQSNPGATYQVQYTTALEKTSTVWSNIGPPVMASGTTASATNSEPSAAASFYRVVTP